MRFADALRRVYAVYPGDLEVAGLFTEAPMFVSPRRLWDRDTARKRPGQS